MVSGCAGDPQKLAHLLAGLPAVQRDAAIAAAHKMFGNGFVDAALHAASVGGNTVGATATSDQSIGKGGVTTSGHSEAHVGGGGISRDSGTHVGADGISSHDSFTVGAGGNHVTVGGGGTIDGGTPQHAQQWMFDKLTALHNTVQSVSTSAANLGNASNRHAIGVRAGQIAAKAQSFVDAANIKLGQAEHSDEWATLVQIGGVMNEFMGITLQVLQQVATFSAVVPTTPIEVQLSACAGHLGTAMTGASVWAAYDAASLAQTAADAAASASNGASNAVDAGVSAVQDGANNAGNAMNNTGNAIKHGLGF